RGHEARRGAVRSGRVGRTASDSHVSSARPDSSRPAGAGARFAGDDVELRSAGHDRAGQHLVHLMDQLRVAAVSLRWRPPPRAGERGALVAIAVGVVVSWVLLVGIFGGGAMGRGKTVSTMSRMPGMPGMSAPSSGLRGSMLLHSGTAAALAMWALMVVAMMLPTALPAVRHVAAASLRWRRGRAIALFVSVYVSVWVAFGAAVVAL